MAREDAADTATTAPSPAMAAFCTSSNDARPDSARMAGRSSLPAPPGPASPPRAPVPSVSPRAPVPSVSPRAPGAPTAAKAPDMRSAPIALSAALWRPTSSRMTTGWPPPVKMPAAWMPPVVANAVWCSRKSSGRRTSTRGSNRSSPAPSPERAAARRAITCSIDVVPQIPHALVVVSSRRPDRSGGASPCARSTSTTLNVFSFCPHVPPQ